MCGESHQSDDAFHMARQTDGGCDLDCFSTGMPVGAGAADFIAPGIVDDDRPRVFKDTLINTRPAAHAFAGARGIKSGTRDTDIVAVHNIDVDARDF